MALTLWRRYVICQQCGAQRPVDDETALAGTCQYCGAPPPEVPKVERAPRAGGIAVTFAVFGALVLGAVWSLGWLDGITSDLGPSGEKERRSAERRATAARYIAVGSDAHAQRATPRATLTLRFEKQRCYGLAVGSGRRLRRVVLELDGKQLFADDVARRWALTTYCPRVSGSYEAIVTLEQPGWLSWRLMQRARPRQKAERLRR